MVIKNKTEGYMLSADDIYLKMEKIQILVLLPCYSKLPLY